MRFQKLLVVFLAVILVLGKAQDLKAADADQSGQAPKLNSTADSSDRLLELLEKKQKELDTQEKSATAAAAEFQTPKTTPATAPKKQAAQPENFFRSKNSVAAPSAPAQSPATFSQTDENRSNVEQDRLLEILRRKQTELDSQSVGAKKEQTVSQPAPKPVPPKINVEKPRTPQTPAVAQPRVATPKAVVSQPALAPEAQDQLLEVLRKKQAELDAKASANKPLQAAEQKKTPAGENVAAKENEASEKRIRQIEAEIKAKEEAFKKSAAQNAAKKSAKKQQAIDAALQAKNQPTSPTGKAPIVAPGSKEARLDELLRKYKADEITPHEYHFERAKIVAEP